MKVSTRVENIIKNKKKTHLRVDSEMCCLEPLLSFPFLWHNLSIIIISRIYKNKITEKVLSLCWNGPAAGGRGWRNERNENTAAKIESQHDHVICWARTNFFF